MEPHGHTVRTSPPRRRRSIHGSGDARSSFVRHATALLLLVVGSLVVSACTGSQTTQTPVVLFLAGTDPEDLASDTSTLRAFEVELPYDPVTGREPIRELRDFERQLPGTVIALAAARQDVSALYALLRIGGVDTLARFDLSGLDADVPASMASTPDALVDLDAIAAAAEGFDEALCARDITVAPDGSWLGLLHDPSGCDALGSPAVLAIELEPDDPSQRGFGPPTLGTQDAAAAPTFVGRGDELHLAWVQADGAVVVWSPLNAEETPEEVVVVDLGTAQPALGRSGTGLAIAYDRDVRYVSLSSGEPGPVWTVEGRGTLGDVLAADTLPGTSSIVVGAEGLAVLTDLASEPDDARIVGASLANIHATVLGPYGYVFVATGTEIRTFDALSATTGGALGSVPAATVDVSDVDSVAITWAFAEGDSGP